VLLFSLPSAASSHRQHLSFVLFRGRHPGPTPVVLFPRPQNFEDAQGVISSPFLSLPTSRPPFPCAPGFFWLVFPSLWGQQQTQWGPTAPFFLLASIRNVPFFPNVLLTGSSCNGRDDLRALFCSADSVQLLSLPLFFPFPRSPPRCWTMPSVVLQRIS